MATRGRKTKRTPEVEKRILDALRVGATREDAFGAAGISERTFYEWMEQFPQFSQSVVHAESACAVRMSARIYQEATAEKGDWKAALEYLKRRRRAEWGDGPPPASEGGQALVLLRKMLFGEEVDGEPAFGKVEQVG